jgi:hypothetical protein
MANRQTPRKSDTTNVVGASAAGGGIGTVIAAIANGMPEHSSYKSLLTVSAPLITVGISGLWLFIKTVYIDPFAARKKYQASDTAMEKVLADARTNAEKVLNDSNSSQEHKQEVRKMVEDLEKLRMKKITERMEIVAFD